MASSQASADSIRVAVGSASTCTSATTALLSDLLSPKPNEGAVATITLKKAPQSTTASAQRAGKPPTGRGRSKTTVSVLEDGEWKDQLPPKERSILATEVINATLKTLSNAIKTLSSTPVHKQAPAKDPTKTTSRRALRRSNSLPPSPLQPRSLNRVISSPDITTGESRPSSSASNASSVYRPSAECARVAFACLRALSSSTSEGVTLPPLQLENGMSVLVGKLVTLGLDDLAVKELRILKRRLETPDAPKKGLGSRPTTTPLSQTLAELLDFGEASLTGGKISLIITTQLQVLRLMASARKPKYVEDALRILDLKHTSSPTRLLLLAAKSSKDAKISDKIARQVQTLSELLLSLCPGVSATDDTLAHESKLSVSPEAAIKLQCMALHNRFLWWGLAGHKGDLSKDIFEPFLRCLKTFARRSLTGPDETYALASSVAKDLQTLLHDCSDTQPRALKTTLAGIYRVLGSLARDANIVSDAIKWTEQVQRVLDPALDSEARRCSVVARLVSLKFRKAPWDSKDEELLLTLLDGLERPFKGEASEIDELMLEVSSARRFVIAMLAQYTAPSGACSRDLLSEGTRGMCEQLIFLCPRLCLRYLGSSPDGKSTTKDILRYEQRRQFIAKRAVCSIDSALFLIRQLLSQDRSTWELVDSKLQDCLLLLDRLDVDSKDISVDGGTSPKSYYTKISNLYYSQFLNMKRSMDSKDGQQLRALRRSLDSIRGRSLQERKGAQFSTKLERMAELYKTTGRYDELYTILLTLRDEMISDGVLSIIAQTASCRPLRVAWALSEQTTALGRTIQSLLKVQLKYLKTSRQLTVSDASWSPEECASILEHQLVILSNQTESDTLSSLCIQIVQELLSIYDRRQYPLRRIRVLLHLASSGMGSHQDFKLYMEELKRLEWETEVKIGDTQDKGLQGFVRHFQTLSSTTIELQKTQPDYETIQNAIAVWASIRAQCQDLTTFSSRVEDVVGLLRHLETIANWLQMKGFDTTRVAALRLVTDINELCGETTTPDDLVLSFCNLGEQWLQLGYSGKAGLALDKARSYNHRNGVSAYASLQLHLSYCEYLIAIGSIDKVDDHMACAQTFYTQQKDYLAKSNSTSALQQRTRMNILISNAYTVNSMLALERGAGHIALSHAKQSVRLLRRAWTNAGNQCSPRSILDTESHTDADKLAEELSQMNLATTSELVARRGEEMVSGTNFWGLVTPLFRGLAHLSALFAHQGMFQETAYYAEQAYKLAQEVGSDSLLAMGAVVLGGTWLKAGSLEKGSEFLTHAKEFLSSNHQSRENALLSYHMGRMHGILGDCEAEISAYEHAEELLKVLASSEHIQALESVDNKPSSLESQLANLSLSTEKPNSTKIPIARTKRNTARKTTARAKTPLKVTAPVAEECPQLMSLHGMVLRQKARAMIMSKQLVDALCLLNEAESFPRTQVDLVDFSLLKAKQLLLQTFDQMNADPVYSVLQDSTISFPSTVGLSKEKHGDKLAISKGSPPRRMQSTRSNRDRNITKSPAPDSFVEKLRQAQEQLLEAHAIALVLAPVAVVHSVSALLNSISIILSALNPTKGKLLAHPGMSFYSIGKICKHLCS
jgi:separase